MVDPVLNEHGADDMLDHNCVFTSIRGGLDHVFAVVPEGKIVAVADVPIDRNIPFSRVGVDKNEASIRASSDSLDGFIIIVALAFIRRRYRDSRASRKLTR